ncbi:MAG TPA: glycosyltransferase [Gemmatimonadales bacterium]|nr:glycosyltransferase [Gemmatimonadales bacterium]
MPTVTVILPTYNRADLLPLAVASALNQTRLPDEILIVDDGSTDDTPAVAAGFGAPVRYIRQDNAGVAAARNHGFRVATGDYLALLDADDLWMPDKLAIQLAALAANPAVRWSVTNCEVIGFDGRPLEGIQGFRRVFPVFAELGVEPAAHFGRALTRSSVEVRGTSVELYTGDAFELLFDGNFGLPSSVLLHRSLIDEAGGFDAGFRLAEETEFFHRIAAVAPVALVTAPLVQYRTGGTGTLTSPSNTVKLVENALLSLDRAAVRRGALQGAALASYRAGRARLLDRLAYAQLSMLNGTAARAAVLRAWREGSNRSPRSVMLVLLSLVPAGGLRGLHALKRKLRG